MIYEMKHNKLYKNYHIKLYEIDSRKIESDKELARELAKYLKFSKVMDHQNIIKLYETFVWIEDDVYVIAFKFEAYQDNLHNILIEKNYKKWNDIKILHFLLTFIDLLE